MGIRMALGAEPVRVVRLLTVSSLRWTVAGVGCGLAMAVVATRILSTLLYGVSAVDAVAFTGVSLVLATTAYVATWLPARRAARVDPMVALRCE